VFLSRIGSHPGSYSSSSASFGSGFVEEAGSAEATEAVGFSHCVVLSMELE